MNGHTTVKKKKKNIFLLSLPLFAAVSNNNLGRVRWLVEQGADKDKGGIDGWTPLIWASAVGHFEVAQYLVEHGATLDKANTKGDTPLIGAVDGGHLEVARYLLEQGADRDKANNNSNTPLHYAALYGHLEIAMLLMSYGADLNARNDRGQLAIDMGHRNTEEIKQAIRRRMDHGHKRATEQDRHPNAVQQLQHSRKRETEKYKRRMTIITNDHVTTTKEQ